MKRSEILFGLLKLPIDILMVFAGVALAYRLRNAGIDLIPRLDFTSGPPQLPEFSYYLSHFALAVIVLYIVLLAILGLYALRITIGVWKEMGRILLVSLLWLGLIISWYFLVQRQLFFSRLLLLQAVMLVTLFVIAGRSAVVLLQRACLRRGIGIRRVVSFGAQKLPEVLQRTLDKDDRFKYLGHVASLHGLIHEERHRSVDLVLHTDPHPSSLETIQLINHCRNFHIAYSFLPPVFADVPHQLVIGRLGLVPLLSFQPTPLDGWGRVFKRIFDLVVGVMFLITLSPLFLFVAVLIVVLNGFPIFYISRRVGQHGDELVPLIKFRTMQRNADEMKPALKKLSHRTDGPLFKIKDDPRVTKLGKILRRTSIDEMPQLFNVIAGHLSLVGPRPHLQDEVEQYSPHQRRVFAVKPGITGLAQVSGRSDLKFDAEVQLDLRYVEEWSPLFDLWILWRTIFVVLLGKGAD
ncbi:MAG: sugar transferase [Candidatus Peribacteraceae bacterium]|nr:sugar transferase [Candidatus Peribacteraceae bacterium]